MSSGQGRLGDSRADGSPRSNIRFNRLGSSRQALASPLQPEAVCGLRGQYDSTERVGPPQTQPRASRNDSPWYSAALERKVQSCSSQEQPCPPLDAESSSGSDGEALPAGRPQQQAKVKVVIQGEAAQQRGGGKGEDPRLMSRHDLEETIEWETNNLYEYLRGLYSQGLEEAEAGHEFDKETWEQRMGHLRGLLQQRDAEVTELELCLGEQEEALGERDAAITQQAELIRSQAAQIRDLLCQLEHWRAGGGGGNERWLDGGSSRGERWHGSNGASPRSDLDEVETVMPIKAVHKSVAFADTHFVELLPEQPSYMSYREYDSCGLLQALADSFVLHRKRWLTGGGAAALLLLVILLATLIPASRRRSSIETGPEFLQAPVVAATGASFFDITVQLSQPGVVSYMLFKASDLYQQVAGTGKTLLDLIQNKGVSAAAVFDASAMGGSLGPSTAQPGLQQLAAACGWAPVLHGGTNERISLTSVTSNQSAACTAGDAIRRCARCPRIIEDIAYTVLMVAASPTGDTLGAVQVLNAVSQSAAVNTDSVNAPFITNITASSFTLHVQLNTPGLVYYAVLYESIYAPYGPYNLAFETLKPSSSDIVFADPNRFAGALVGNGSFSVPSANEWVMQTIQPPCVGSLCQESLHGLLGGIAYKVVLVAVDMFGSTDPAPLMVPLTTAPDSTAPTLLHPSGPNSVTATSFGVELSMDAAGGVYYLVLAAKAGVHLAEPKVDPGSWTALAALPAKSGRRRLLSAPASSLRSRSSMGAPRWQAGSWGSGRQLLDVVAPEPGSLTMPTCYPANRTCQSSPASVFSGVQGLSAFDVVASGCTQAPGAVQSFSLPSSTNLQNNTLYYVLLATEGKQLPSPTVQKDPTVYAIRTVDLSAARFACGFPTATNISSSGFAVSVMLTKPAWAFYVVLPTIQAGTAPSAVDILRGQGAGGEDAAAAGNMTRAGSLPWETGTAADIRKLWASIAGLQSGLGYTVFVVLTLDGNNPIPGSPVARLSDIFTPATVPPTFTAIAATSTSVDEAAGTFSLDFDVTIDRPGVVFYAVYRAYNCVSGDPSLSDILGGAALAPSICPCSESWYCSLVTAGNFSVAGSGTGNVTIGGGLAPLPFESLRNAPESQLRCFKGGLGQASDTYNIYLVAGSALPTLNGLAPQCSNFAQAAATAAVASTAGPSGAPDGSCASSPALRCSQAQSKADTRIVQSAPIVAWPRAGSAGAGVAAEWQPPAGTSAYSRPAKVQLSFESGDPPAFTHGPDFPATGQQSDGLFMEFQLNKPALVTYAVRSFPAFDPATNDFPPPVLVSTGRVPVFDTNTLHNTTIRACNGDGWPAGPLQPNTQYSVQFVARDKYGRLDGPCPASQPSCLGTTKTNT